MLQTIRSGKPPTTINIPHFLGTNNTCFREPEWGPTSYWSLEEASGYIGRSISSSGAWVDDCTLRENTKKWSWKLVGSRNLAPAVSILFQPLHSPAMPLILTSPRIPSLHPKCSIPASPYSSNPLFSHRCLGVRICVQWFGVREGVVGVLQLAAISRNGYMW